MRTAATTASVLVLALVAALHADAALLTNLGTATTALPGLDGIHQVAVAPDGRHLVFAAEDENALVYFERDPTTGLLSAPGALLDGFGGVDGIEAPGRPAFDPAGNHLYVPGFGEDALAVFRRASLAGIFVLQFVEVQRNGFSGVTGMSFPTHASVSPDGKHVYVATLNGTIVVFARDAVTGALDWLATLDEDDSFGSFAALAIAPDGRHVLAATSADELFSYPRNASTGALGAGTEITNGTGGTSGLGDASDLLVTRDGRHVYVASEQRHVVAFARDPATGALSFVQDEPIAGDHLALSPDGRRLYASYTDVGGAELYAFRVYVRDPGTGALAYLGPSGHFGTIGTSAAHGGHVITPDGAHLYGTWTGESLVAITAIAALSFVEQHRDGVAGVDGLDQAEDVSVSPDGRSVYVAAGGDAAVAVFARDRETNQLELVESEKDGIGGVSGLLGARVVDVAPDGRHVYAIGTAAESLVVFARAPGDGALTFLQSYDPVDVPQLDAVYELEVSPDGRFVYAAAGATIVRFSRDSDTGLLAFEDVLAAPSSASLAFGTGGAQLFAAGSSGGHGLGTFPRDPATGVLSPFAFLSLPLTLTEMAAARDGRHLYLHGRDSPILRIDRDPQTGDVALGETLGSYESWYWCYGLALERSGRFLMRTCYTTDPVYDLEGWIDVYRRDPTTGALGFAQVERGSPSSGPLALEGARAVAVSPDGRATFVATSQDALVVFSPEPGAAPSLAAALLSLLVVARRARVRAA